MMILTATGSWYIYCAKKTQMETHMFQLDSCTKYIWGWNGVGEFLKWLFRVFCILSQTWRRRHVFSFHFRCRIFIFLNQEKIYKRHWLNINKIFQFECSYVFPLISENKYGRRSKDLTKTFFIQWQGKVMLKV